MTDPTVETSHEEARRLIATAVNTEPLLTYFGAGSEAGASFADQRSRLESALDEVAASADWIKQQRTLRTLNAGRSSYGYKHEVEAWRRRRGDPLYISNGSFIAAALGLGLKGKLVGTGPNMRFGISERTIK